MAKKRWNIVKAIDLGNGKTHWHKLGVMFETKSGNGFNILMDSIPASEEGQYKMSAFEHKDQEDRPAAREDLDDEIPF
jgi:hypothetical protein